MDDRNEGMGIKILVAVTFVVMVAVNALANILPIAGRTTGDVSDAYENLFAPAPYTFSIWGLIYLLLAGYTLYQFGVFQAADSRFDGGLSRRVGLLFSLSSIANAAWILAWHYDLIPLSMVLMVVILVCLILVTRETNRRDLTARDRLFVWLPFSVYFGWITVATIANATTLLVDLGWNGFGISEPVWTVLVLLVGLAIATATIWRDRNIAYALTVAWAYTGILVKHVSAGGFAGQYPAVIATAIVGIAVLLVAGVYRGLMDRRPALAS